MTLPNGITTCNVTFGKALGGALGTAGTITGTVTIDRPVVWAATGDALYAVPEALPDQVAGGWVTIAIPVVDQAGYLDQAGNAVTNFAFVLQAEVKFPGQPEIKVRREFQVFTGQTNVDLDLIPAGSIQQGVTAPSAAVTSVNGQTGAVSVSGADDAGVASQVTNGTATKAALSASIADYLDEHGGGGGGGGSYGPGEGPVLTSPDSATVRQFHTNEDGTLVGQDTGDGAPAITDNFNRADSGVLGAPWEQVLNGVGIVGNQAGPGTGFANFNSNWAVRDCGTANGRLFADKGSDQVGQGLVFRYVDNDNCFIANGASVVRREGGVNTGITTFGLGNGGAGSTMEVRFDGDQIQVWYNGSLLETATDSFNQDATKHGLLIGYATDRLDNWSFTPSDPPVLDTYVTETAAADLIADGTRYNPQTNVYNAVAPSPIQRARAARARAEAGTDQLVIGVASDSMGDGTAHDIKKCWPEQLQTRLVAAGLPRANSFLRTSHTFVSDTRVALAGYALVEDSRAVSSTTANDTITSTHTFAGTIVDQYYWDKETGSTFTVAVDGATSGAGFTTVTTTGTGLIKKVTLTGLASAAHTVVVKHTNTVADYQIASEVRIAGPGVRLLNYSIAAQGIEDITAVNWHGKNIGQMDFMLFEKPDVVFLEAGGNNGGVVLSDQVKASYTAGVQALRTAKLDVVLVAPHPVLETSDSDIGMKEVQALARSVAVSKGCIAVDLHDRYYPTSNEDLGFYADSLHLSGVGDLDVSRVMLNLLSS